MRDREAMRQVLGLEIEDVPRFEAMAYTAAAAVTGRRPHTRSWRRR